MGHTREGHQIRLVAFLLEKSAVQPCKSRVPRRFAKVQYHCTPSGLLVDRLSELGDPARVVHSILVHVMPRGTGLCFN